MSSQSEQLYSMRPETWHPGKLAMVWVGVFIAFSVAKSVDEGGVWIVFLIFTAWAAETTWKWFSARERGRLSGQNLNGALRAYEVLIGCAANAQRTFMLRALELDTVSDPMKGEIERASLKEAIERESYVLMFFAADWGCYTAVSGNVAFRGELMTRFGDLLANGPRARHIRLTRESLNMGRAEYADHLLGFEGADMLMRTGSFFARRCDVGDPILALTASMLFGELFAASQEAAGSMAAAVGA
jgi:hypothetical protein